MERPDELRCRPNPECKYYNKKIGCHKSTHHMLWPRNLYTYGVPRRLRQVLQVEMCAALHDTIHATTEPPEVPTQHEAIDMLIQRDETYERFMRNLLDQVNGLQL